MKKLQAFIAALFLVALGTVSLAATNLSSLTRNIHQFEFENSGAGSMNSKAMPASANAAPAQTITICKKTIPAGGAGFPFSWANGFGSLAPFTLNDGQCTTKNMTGQDHYNKFTENVPAGWALTNIACTYTTSPVKIIGANSNPAFQPGDNTVTIDLNEPNVTCTFTNQQQSQVDPCCPPWNKDILKDALSYQGSGSITAPYTLHFNPGAMQNQMQAYINYLHAINPAITGITIDWRLHDQSPFGSPPYTIYGPQVGSTAYATWTWNTTGIGNPILNPNSFFTLPGYPMNVNTWYMVHTGIYLENGQKFFPDTCANNEINVRFQVLNNKSAGTSSQPVLEFSDGKRVIKSIPLSEMKRQR